jgi:hypothetical protein
LTSRSLDQMAEKNDRPGLARAVIHGQVPD